MRGLQAGGTTTLVFDGDDLGTAPRLLLPFAAKAELKPKATDKQATFDVTLGADVPPGLYNLRVVTDGGVTLPVVVAVDRLPQRALSATTAELPVALHGVAASSTPIETTFTGEAGQKLMVEVEARRLGSRLRPVVHLYAPNRLQIAWAWGVGTDGGDARLEATLPADGTYAVTVHDAEYASPTPNHFRLKIGQWSYVDQVFPPVIGKGRTSVELLGPPAPSRVEIDAATAGTVQLVPWPKDGAWSGPRPFVSVNDRPEVVEQPSAAKGQVLPPGTGGVSGRLLTPYEEDRYRVLVQPGTKVRLEVFAERLGSPIDAALVVRNDAGAELARGEDSPGSLDPVLEYAVPEKVTSIVVGVVDALGRGGPRGLYRLAIAGPESNSKKDFRLSTPAQRIAVPVDGRSVLPILVERRGYIGSITLSAEGLPSGCTLENATIPAGADGSLVVLRRSPTAGIASVALWRGRAEDGQQRTIVVKGHPLERLQPWLAEELAVAPTTARAADFQIDWRNLPADAGPVLAGKLALPVKVVRLDPNSIVRLTLLTSQLPPLVNNQPDPNQTLRAEKPVELAAKIAEGEVVVLVPPQLNSPLYDVTVQAELLTADKTKVLATASAPVRRMTVRNPLLVSLQGPQKIEVKLDAKKGATVPIKGKVERREKLAGDVALTLTGLPPGARADAVTVKAGANDFTVNVILPPNLPPGEVKGLKLAGTVAPDSKQPNVRVRSREIDVTLLIKPPGPWWSPP